jgi:hypothetical protein
LAGKNTAYDLSFRIAFQLSQDIQGRFFYGYARSFLQFEYRNKQEILAVEEKGHNAIWLWKV